MAAMTRGSAVAPGVCDRKCPLVGKPDQAVIPVGLAQPLKVPLSHLRACGLELDRLR